MAKTSLEEHDDTLFNTLERIYSNQDAIEFDESLKYGISLVKSGEINIDSYKGFLSTVGVWLDIYDGYETYPMMFRLLHSKTNPIIFKLNKELTDYLLNTETANFNFQNIFPYNSFYLELKDEYQLISKGKILQGIHVIVDGNGEIELTLVFPDGDCTYYNMRFYKNLTIKENIEIQYTKLYKNNEYSTENKEEIDIVINLIFGFCLYLSTSNPDIQKEESKYNSEKKRIDQIKSGSKKAKAMRHLEKTESKFPVYYVGRTYINKGIADKARSIQNELEHRTIDKTFRVRGHWRKQPIEGIKENKEEQKFKIIWIEPFWKGKLKNQFIEAEKIYSFVENKG